MYSSTCADMQVDVMGECLSSIKHVVGVRSVFLAEIARRIAVKITPSCCLSEKWRIINLLDDIWMLLSEVESLGSCRKAAVRQVWLQSSELLTASFHDFGDNFKLQEQLSGGSVVVVHEEPHPQMTGTFSYRPEEIGGRQRKKSLNYDTCDWTTDIAFYRGRQTARWWSVCTTPCTMCTFNACPSEKAFSVVPGTPELRDNEWGRVLFTDESRFSLSSDSHRILIWRERGSRNHPSNIIERDRYGGVMGLQFLFMDDNAPCHRTVAAEQLLESEDIERMDCPARSLDLNPIEHVWDFLGRRLAARTLPPVTIRELRLALQDEWAAMPQQLIDTLILSMSRRCETCLAVRGDHIIY
ncbi:transposable element Tcb1 transposase [Trichonephila clavipes]|nr:transposable element Tcb1 transposase [Trichonephila clavipes]